MWQQNYLGCLRKIFNAALNMNYYLMLFVICANKLISLPKQDIGDFFSLAISYLIWPIFRKVDNKFIKHVFLGSIIDILWNCSFYRRVHWRFSFKIIIIFKYYSFLTRATELNEICCKLLAGIHSRDGFWKEHWSPLLK